MQPREVKSDKQSPKAVLRARLLPCRAMQYEKCYVYSPEDARPAKRRRVEPQGLQASWGVRHKAYKKAWQARQKEIDENLRAVNEATVSHLGDFLDENLTRTSAHKIPTGIISAGPDAASYGSIIVQAAQHCRVKAHRSSTSISASTGSNLKALLKAIIQKVTARAQGEDEDEDEMSSATKAGPRLLNYDLQILCDHARERKIDQIVVAIQEVEAFSSDLLSELIEMLAVWCGRIPFVLLFGLATSVDFLQQRLSKGAVRCLEGRLFNAASAAEEVEAVFQAVTDPESRVCIGPGLMATSLERQTDCIQGIGALVDTFQYVYMSCYYANPLSIFLDSDVKYAQTPKDHLEAARNLDSFRAYCRELLETHQPTRLRDMLDDDETLFGTIRYMVAEGRKTMNSMNAAIDIVQILQQHLQQQPAVPRSKLYIQAMSGKLRDSITIRSLLLSLRKAPSDTSLRVLTAVQILDVSRHVRDQCSDIQDELSQTIQDQAASGQQLRSEDDVKNSTLRTTIVAQKVELSKQKCSLSKEDAAYTILLRKFTNVLQEFFSEALVDVKSLTFHEIFVYDFKSPHRETFTPRPRHAIERALAAPHDYLNCDCCQPAADESEDVTLAASQPATATLYQLYLESESLINVSDLWQAFQAVMGKDRAEEQNVALFQRALAELQYLGLMKSTRKRVDHVAKVAWRGL